LKSRMANGKNTESEKLPTRDMMTNAQLF
jgi:hypothetical protein